MRVIGSVAACLTIVTATPARAECLGPFGSPVTCADDVQSEAWTLPFPPRKFRIVEIPADDLPGPKPVREVPLPGRKPDLPASIDVTDRDAKLVDHPVFRDRLVENFVDRWMEKYGVSREIGLKTIVGTQFNLYRAGGLSNAGLEAAVKESIDLYLNRTDVTDGKVVFLRIALLISEGVAQEITGKRALRYLEKIPIVGDAATGGAGVASDLVIEGTKLGAVTLTMMVMAIQDTIVEMREIEDDIPDPPVGDYLDGVEPAVPPPPYDASLDPNMECTTTVTGFGMTIETCMPKVSR